MNEVDVTHTTVIKAGNAFCVSLPDGDVQAVLVDDTLKHRHLWEEAGGIFIHHRDVAETLSSLDRFFPLHSNA